MTLESSETEFASRYAAWAAVGQVYPQREGSPLLEFSSGGRVLYLFDRSGPYVVRPGPARLVVHGILDLAATEPCPKPEDAREQLTVIGISGLEGVGEVLDVSRRSWVVRARLPLVLSSFTPLPDARPGDWVTFRTLPLLHGFAVERDF
ncbi:hypothetical protein E7T06_04070 [Deinococcus sp. Arct2-2]|uniref:hypothetical protein n=1 Tax=Deinococcus sp. Arct2-2 TaxID=2568653 RepID=UPI0010A311EE|nr:hypothetical protein [Deinococcus sp. Arct2-2]THF71250.1 hypothetical protein E7T06_04070 [Deinococcus sp. Arct2-2]